MYIGEISKLTGLSIKAIRFYEARGLLPAPQRQGRYRVYHASDIEILMLIKGAKTLGITLTQLSNAVHFENGKLDWLRIMSAMQEIRQQFVTDIEELNRKIKLLDLCCKQIAASTDICK